MQSSFNHGADVESEAKLKEDLEAQLCLTQESCTQNAISEENEEEEEEFSFMYGGGNSSPIAAEDAFINGQIKPVFPLFNRDLLFGEMPQVKKMFVQMKGDDDDEEDDDDDYHQGTVKMMTSSTSGNNEISGPCCEWSKESSSSSSAAVAPELSKKSNSTGFSKLWRFRDLLSRSNSDGRDTFVFLNNQQTTSSEVRKEEKKSGNNGKATKGKKSKTTTLSPHEVYLKSKAKEDDRRRSYLPYRPEVFGFFTNVNGGMSRNVHPF